MTVTYRQLVLCPFCSATIAETGLFYDHAGLEAACRTHLRNDHPLRWRLHRKFRRAMRVPLWTQPVSGGRRIVL